jgi:hypothetical protein
VIVLLKAPVVKPWCFRGGWRRLRLCFFYRNVPQKELDLLQLASRSMAEPITGYVADKRRSATLGANSGFDQPSMIALASEPNP